MAKSKNKKQIQLESIGNNVFRYEQDNMKFMVRQVVSGWQVEEYTKFGDKWEKQAVWPIKSLGGIVLEIEE